MRAEIERELRSNLLPFWRGRCEDRIHGGFIARMSGDGVVDSDAPRGLILNSRLLWTYSALHRQLGETRDLELAKRAYHVLQERFLDSDHGGYQWRVDAGGGVLDAEKKIYGQAFCVYALSEFFLSTGDTQALDAARRVFELIEANAHVDRTGGYLESRAADWSASDVLQLAPNDMVAAKSMNTHLHLLEAYTNLYRAWPETDVAARLRELIGIFELYILHDGHLHHFFDEGWRVLSDSCTFGHDIEAAWLLAEAAEALADEALIGKTSEWTAEIAKTVQAEAIGADGAIAYEGRGGSVIDQRREWWCQAEAVVGFWHTFQLTGDQVFARLSNGVWRFISSRVVDRVGGEWHWRIREDGSVDLNEPKVSEWKGPYHNVRMCLEMMRRIGEGSDGGSQ